MGLRLIGRELGPGAFLDETLKAEGRVFERLEISKTVFDAAILAAEPIAPARRFCRPVGRGSWRPELGHVRESLSGKLPAVSNSLFVESASNPVVLEQEPNDDEAHGRS